MSADGTGRVGADGIGATAVNNTPNIDEWMARSDDEDILWSGRPRVTTVLPSVAVGLLLVLVGVGGGITQNQPALLLVAAVGLTIPLVAYVRLVNIRFVVTDHALYRKTGVLSRSVERIALRRVQNSAFHQGVLGSAFDYGTVSVEAAGGGAIAFSDIDNPRAVRELVEKQLDDEEIPGSAEQWAAVLGEVQLVRQAFETRTR